MAKDIEHFFIYLLVICTFFGETIFVDWIICSSGVPFFELFVILNVNPLLDEC
jgi:hypothetical protein